MDLSVTSDGYGYRITGGGDGHDYVAKSSTHYSALRALMESAHPLITKGEPYILRFPDLDYRGVQVGFHRSLLTYSGRFGGYSVSVFPARTHDPHQASAAWIPCIQTRFGRITRSGGYHSGEALHYGSPMDALVAATDMLEALGAIFEHSDESHTSFWDHL